MQLQYLAEWFLTGGARLPRGASTNFQVGEPLSAVQHWKFD